jgi:hypothetical protein
VALRLLEGGGSTFDRYKGDSQTEGRRKSEGGGEGADESSRGVTVKRHRASFPIRMLLAHRL